MEKKKSQEKERSCRKLKKKYDADHAQKFWVQDFFLELTRIKARAGNIFGPRS